MLEIIQLHAGRDFARTDPRATQMANFAYLVIDRASGECALVDPAWDVAGLLARVQAEKGRLVAVVATHSHWDHVGGSFAGNDVEGVAKLVAAVPVPVWVNRADAPKLMQNTGLPASALKQVSDGDVLKLGQGEIRFLHTPGHTPGGHCLYTGQGVITGDTLFVDECGRVDLPGSDPRKMEQSLKRLMELPDQVVVYPGHDYGPSPTATIADQRRTNPTVRPGAFDGD